jgi:hypothetical protein
MGERTGQNLVRLARVGEAKHDAEIGSQRSVVHELRWRRRPRGYPRLRLLP